MRGKKTKIEDKLKVIEAKLRDPELSTRDITKETGINKQTTADILNKVPEVLASSGKEAQMILKIDQILDDVMDMTVTHISKYMDEDKMSKKDLKTLTEISEINFKRKQLLTGKPTDIKDVKIDLSNATMKELEEYRQQLIG